MGRCSQHWHLGQSRFWGCPDIALTRGSAFTIWTRKRHPGNREKLSHEGANRSWGRVTERAFPPGPCQVQRSENVPRPANRARPRAKRKPVRRDRVFQATVPSVRPCRKSCSLATQIFAEWRFWALKTLLLAREDGLAGPDIWPRGGLLWLGRLCKGVGPQKGVSG